MVEKSEKIVVDSSLPIVDNTAIQRLRDLESPEDEVPFSKQMINGFFASVPGMMQGLQQAFAAASEKDLAFFAHKLAGFSMNVGGRRFATLCQTIEVSAASAIAQAGCFALAEAELSNLLAELKKI